MAESTTQEGHTNEIMDMGKEVKPHSQSISLPQELEACFRNLGNVKRFAIDIGGSLTKIAYFSTVSNKRAQYGPIDVTHETPRLHFIKFETKLIHQALEFIQKHLLHNGVLRHNIKATGGGAYRYADLIEEKLGLLPEKEDEVDCLIKGANFLLKNVSEEAFTYERRRDPEYNFLPAGPVLFPYLLVNVGSGVSILKVHSEDTYTRIGGTATGGGTFWGLGSLITGAKGFDDLLRLAEKGDHRNIDMLVGDIYAGDCVNLKLPKDLIASSFGKAPHLSPSEISPADAARSLLFTIANDIGQIACLYALQQNLTRIYFGGFFLRNHPLTMYAVSYAIRYWSKGGVESLFLRHEGYLGAIGAFLKGTEDRSHSWTENYVGSSGFLGDDSAGSSLEILEMDRAECPVAFCPLLSSCESYTPDTVNLSNDTEARIYWINCLQRSVDRVVERAMESQVGEVGSVDRALRCKKKLTDRFRRLSSEPRAFGTLSVRSLLDTMEQCLREFEFPDPYMQQKHTENLMALESWDAQIGLLEKLSPESRVSELIWGILAGNVFDWGAEVVARLLEGPSSFGFQEARDALQCRPWLVDGLNQWEERMKGPPHRCATIFVDNAGFDFILGILPFVRELLRRGTKVILCANSEPALNDMTFREMVPLLHLVAEKCEIIRDALHKRHLVPHGSGQSSPCLDLSRVSLDLVTSLKEMDSDLVVIEGMGRAIHTNLFAKFRTEVLKLAVIKNGWLAERFGGEIFSVVCSYEVPIDQDPEQPQPRRNSIKDLNTNGFNTIKTYNTLQSGHKELNLTSCVKPNSFQLVGK